MSKEFYIQSMIGKGAFGSVHKAVFVENQRLYAVKRIRVATCKRYDILNTVNEIRILANHMCPFIVSFKRAYMDAEHVLCLVMEYAIKGDLAGLLQRKRDMSQHMNDSDVWHYMLQLMLAVSYIHTFHIIHRDIKPANVMIDGDNNVKLGDFGVSKVMKTYMMYGQTQVGTPYYMGPEVLRCERYDERIDTWSLGCILYELMYLKHPFVKARNFIELRNCVLNTVVRPLSHPIRCSDLKILLQSLLKLAPRQRPHMSTVINSRPVRNRIKTHNMEFALKHEIKKTFYANTPVPRSIQDWDLVLRIHVDLNATTTPDNELQKKLSEMDAHLELNKKIQSLLEGIADAKKYISECESVLKILQERKSVIQHTFKGGKPTPPPSAPPPHRSPRVFKT